MYDAIFKVVIFGDAGCGKTTFTKRFITDKFIPNSHKTIGVDFEIKSFMFDGLNIKLMIWDFGGEERFRFIFPQYIVGAMGGIVLYDITNYSSLSHVENWLSIMNGTEEGFPIILVGGKSDLGKYREIPAKEGKKVAKVKGLQEFLECSSKTGENVEKTFESLTKLMLNRIKYEEVATLIPIPER
jgi:small GTP-binding protein